jgi:hypothetical protein
VPGEVLVAAAPNGAAFGAIPIDIPVAPRTPPTGVKPGSPARNGLPSPNSDPLVMAGSRLVIRIGTVTSKIACRWDETGEAAKTTAQLMPMVDGMMLWVLLPLKFPVTVLAEHGAVLFVEVLNCRTAGTKRSVAASLFSTVKGSDIVATT